MEEIFLGGIADISLGRSSNDVVQDWLHAPGSYGIYFTSTRLIGVSYKRTTSPYFRPGYIFFAIFIVVLVSELSYLELTGLQALPISSVFLFGPFGMGAALLSLTFLMFISPRQASRRLVRETATSTVDLEHLSKDLVLERSDIAQVTFELRRINILSKSGDWYFFMNRLGGKRARLLLDLFQRFCAPEPSIELFVYRNKWLPTSWQKPRQISGLR